MAKFLNCKSQIVVLIALSLIIMLVVLRLGISSVLADREDIESIEKGLSFNQSNALATYKIARINQFFMTEEEERIKEIYVNSLRENPLFTVAWIGLAETLIEMDEDNKAHLALTRARGLIPSSIGLLWESSLLAFSLGDIELATDMLKMVAKADPKRRQRVFDICHELIDDYDLILRRVVSDETLGDYLRYLVAKDMLDATYLVWQRVETKMNIPDEVALSYVNYLMKKGDADRAKRIQMRLRSDGA